MGHAMVRAGLGLTTRGRRSTKPWRPDVVHAHDWLVAHPAIALAEHFDVPLVSTIHATEAGRHSGWVSGRISRQVHAVECVAGARIRFAHHVFGVDARRDHRTVRARPCRDAGHPQRHRRRPVAVRASAGRARGPRRLLYLGRLEYEKGVHDVDRRPAPHPAHPSRHHADHRRRRHPAGLARRAGAKAQGAQGRRLRRPRRPRTAGRAARTTPTPPCCPATTSRSASSHSRPRRPARRWSRPTSAASARPSSTARPACRSRRATSRRWPRRCAPCSTIPAAAQRVAVAARERLTSDFDWHTVAAETAQVYLAAKRREREPHRRGMIVEHALPDR